MESIADAWKILDDMYGDAATVINAKVLELRSLDYLLAAISFVHSSLTLTLVSPHL